MPRPFCCRRVPASPVSRCFQPLDGPVGAQEEILMTLDELEAIRLADLEGHYHEQAAGQMGVSRPTFGRILEVGRRKVAQALVQGLRLRIEGGPINCREWNQAGARKSKARCPHCRGRQEREANVTRPIDKPATIHLKQGG